MYRAGEFEAHINRMLRQEREPTEHSGHPDPAEMLEALGGDLPDDRRAQLVAHVTSCPPCAKRWNELSRLVEEEVASLERRARVPSLQQLVREQHKVSPRAGIRERVAAWWTTLFPQPVLRPALAYAATAVTAVVITLLVATPFIRQPGVQPDDLLAFTKSADENDVWVSIPGVTVKPITVGTEELRAIVDVAEGIDAAWQRTLYVTGELERYGVRIPDSLDLATTTAYVVREDDTWRSIAEETLGEVELWPLLFLLNADRLPTDDEPEPGTELAIPDHKG